MAQVEPMDLDDMESEFDDKENSYQINNALTRPNYLEVSGDLNISERNIKIRHSITPALPPMSKSFTANYTDDKIFVSLEDQKDIINYNLTRSLNSSLPSSDSVLKAPKALPLQSISTQESTDINESVRHSLNTVQNYVPTPEMECLSLPSTSSSLAHTPEATTPTKEIPKHDGGSPILRGLKSVLSMFRSSQSPISPTENNNEINIIENVQTSTSEVVPTIPNPQNVLASTPIRSKNPLKETVVFNDDLERELQWKDDSAVFFKEEKIPVHILFPSLESSLIKANKMSMVKNNTNTSVEYMDISLNESVLGNINKDLTLIKTEDIESDNEFQDCETSCKELTSNKVCDAPQTLPNLNKTVDVNMSVTESTEVVLPQIILKEGEFSEPLNSSPDEVEALLETQPTPGIIDDYVEHFDDKPLDFKVNFELQSHLANIISYNDVFSETIIEPTLPASCNQPDKSYIIDTDLMNKSIEHTKNTTFEINQTVNIETTNNRNDSCTIIPTEESQVIKSTLSHMETANTSQNTENIIDKIENHESSHFQTHPVNKSTNCLLHLPVVSKTNLIENNENHSKLCIELVEKKPADTNLRNVNTYLPDIVQVSQETEEVSENANEIIICKEIPILEKSISNDDCISTISDSTILCSEETVTEETNIMLNENTLQIIPQKSINDQDVTSAIIESDNSLQCLVKLQTPKISEVNQAIIASENLQATTELAMTQEIIISNKLETGSSSLLETHEVDSTNEKNKSTEATDTSFSDKPDVISHKSTTVTNHDKFEKNSIQCETDEVDMDDSNSHHDIAETSLNNTIVHSPNLPSEEMLNEMQVAVNTCELYELETILDNYTTTQKSCNERSEIVGDPFQTNSKIPMTPPGSPKIVSKGYNFNFDDIDDPSSTKTKTRSSPSTSPPRMSNPINRNESNQQLKRKSNPSAIKNSMKPKNRLMLTEEKTGNIEIINDEHENINRVGKDIETLLPQVDKTISDENIDSAKHRRNVFSIPEIDDKHFNPFATRTKVCCTPPLSNLDNTDDIDFKECNTTVVLDENLNLGNMLPTENNVLNLSTHAEERKEINTEDEDTIEGPFLENEDEKDDPTESGKDNNANFACGQVNPVAFEELPKQPIEDLENEMFIDAEAFEFLLNKNQAHVVADCGKESLFLKFDPLFAKRMSTDGIFASLGKVSKRQSTPKKDQLAENALDNDSSNNLDVAPSSSKTLLSYDQNDESNINNVSKPTMVVNPAVVSARKSTTPPKINRLSLTFTSPAMAVIDRLLSLTGNMSQTMCPDTSLPEVYSEQNHTESALTQLREMLAEKEIHVQTLRDERKELNNRLDMLETQVKSLEYESEDRLRKIKDLDNQISEKNKQNKTMARVVEEYERTIATLVAELDQDKKQHAEERMQLIRDRDEQTAHLASMEISFNDLHSKYEKSKQIILSLKSNEDILKKALKDFEDNQRKIENNYELLKQHATSKLNHANEELKKLNKGHEAEVLKLKAIVKRKDMHITSLEETLAQKTKANEELTAICDELINKVG